MIRTYDELTGRNRARQELELELVRAEMEAALEETEAAVETWRAQEALDRKKLQDFIRDNERQ